MHSARMPTISTTAHASAVGSQLGPLSWTGKVPTVIAFMMSAWTSVGVRLGSYQDVERGAVRKVTNDV